MAWKKLLVEHIDQLLKLSESQLKVWLYHFRREGGGENRVSFVAQDTVREATHLSRSAITHARTWLVRNGWLEIVGLHPGYGSYPVREYRCLVPQRDREKELEKEVEDSFGLGTCVPTLGIEKPKSPTTLGTGMPNPQARESLSLRHGNAADVDTCEVDSLEVYKVKGQEEKKEGNNETGFAALTPIEAILEPKSIVDQDEDKTTELYWYLHVVDLSVVINPDGTIRKSQDPTHGSMDDIITVLFHWRSLTGNYDESPAVIEAIASHFHWRGDLDTLLEYMTTMVKHFPKTSKIAWRDLKFFLDKFEYNKRQVDAWKRGIEAKATAPTGLCFVCRGQATTRAGERNYCEACIPE
jgi:hypothetical protein